MILYIIGLLFSIASGVIILQVALSWLIAFGVINAENDAARRLIALLKKLTDPVYTPLRKFIPPIGGIDITPLIVLIGLNILRSLVLSLLAGILY